jgi:hypothetical protein
LQACCVPTPESFVHHLAGLPLYIELIRAVAALGSPVVAVEYRHVALRLTCAALRMPALPLLPPACGAALHMMHCTWLRCAVWLNVAGRPFLPAGLQESCAHH